jgi:hypothetical protein
MRIMKEILQLAYKCLIGLLLFSGTSAYPYYPRCDLDSFQYDPTMLSTLNGRIKGECYEVNVNDPWEFNKNVSILTWLGVPYAEPPVNENRFKKPVPVRSWKTILNGTKWPNRCVQGEQFFENYFKNDPHYSIELMKIDDSEDCLYLNIFVPLRVYTRAVRQGRQTARVPILGKLF